ncbi:Polyketide cyclase SnoaL-like domain-containing protein [Quillaja saponaria]|uniref:Polyketide cyclase SnoaL-like domain-containing protein n=1 Tax=Quillaja saponaria TaxID=32244 RepID=A0AAD7M158_QUISA|nr:Polyketide cyclase SnoaL-like domain-containing protein [Quillaja saponaria]
MGSSGEEDKQALDAVLKFYSAIKNKNISGLSDIIGDECRCECNFFSFFQAFQGKKQVMEFFSYLIKSLGNRIQIVVQPTLHDGMNVGVHWKLEWSKIHVPSGKGFSFHICQTYHGRVVIRNMEMFMEPLLHFEPIRLKMMAYLTTILYKTNSYVVSNNKAARVLSILLVLLLIAALLIFLRITSYRPMP